MSKFQWGIALLLAASLVMCTSGCLRRRMTINSNPPGATVYVDGHQIGRTPISTDFTYYGTRDIRLEKDNYQTLRVKQPVRPPWYELPPFEFFAETFTPGEVKDRHVWTYDLTQRVVGSEDHILDRAKEFAYEGSRAVNEDGTLGAPILAENLPQNQSRPQVYYDESAPPADVYSPNAFPEGSADWDSPPR